MVGGNVSGEHDIGRKGMYLGNPIPLGLTVLFSESNQLKSSAVRTRHNKPTRVPIQERVPKGSHLIADRGGIRLNGAHASVIEKGLLKVPAGLLVGKGDLDGHRGVRVVAGILSVTGIDKVFRAAA